MPYRLEMYLDRNSTAREPRIMVELYSPGVRSSVRQVGYCRMMMIRNPHGRIVRIFYPEMVSEDGVFSVHINRRYVD